MRALIVKTSSLGDVLHTLPAVTDAQRAISELQFDWVVEEDLADIPGWHPAVHRAIPTATRRWRRETSRFVLAEARAFWRALRAYRYDAVIDAQGLLKSALITRCARGLRWGFDRRCAREPLATPAYQYRVRVDPDQHAIDRMRQLFAASLGYRFHATSPQYGVDRTRLPPADPPQPDPYLVFFHGTTWRSKHWPEAHWEQLVALARGHGHTVLLPWGDATEYQRAARLATAAPNAHVLPRLTLSGLAAILAGARGAVAVDTGLGHLAAALGTPCVSVYGATDPARTGTQGPRQLHATADFPCAPCLRRDCQYAGTATVYPACYASVPPHTVWSILQSQVTSPDT